MAMLRRGLRLRWGHDIGQVIRQRLLVEKVLNLPMPDIIVGSIEFFSLIQISNDIFGCHLTSSNKTPSSLDQNQENKTRSLCQIGLTQNKAADAFSAFVPNLVDLGL